jgi:hypothetical protein
MCNLDEHPSGCAVYGMGLWLLASWDCGFKSGQGHGCPSLVSCVLLGRGLCVGLISHPEKLYRVWCV